MKILVSSLMILFSPITIGQASNLYYERSYDQPGYKAVIKEIERGSNFSILQLEIVESDAQGAFTMIAAAVDIGKQLGKSHFTIISQNTQGKISYLKIFFTDNPSVDPNEVFPGEMSNENIEQFGNTGFLSVKQYDSLLKITPNN